ncbi:MAG: radical SAM protein [Desulfobacteraceae bacterium]|jgi:radical SAM protein with 4Fe4S-binding SPASM domain
MNAERINGQSVGGKRTRLAEVIPLATPFLVQIFPAYVCNFKCSYCIHSLPKKDRGFIADKTIMDFDLYKKCIDDLVQFPQKIKMLRFAATGEPLLHPQIAEMIKHAKDKKVGESLEIVTNASLLTKELSDDLIDAGLDWLRISIQGLSSQKYKAICGVDIDLDEFTENIRYFYKNRKECKVYIKIIDCALEENEEEKFYDIFGSICDKIAIEHLNPAVPEIDYTKLSDTPLTITQNGNAVQNAEICPQPFYMLQINPDGNIVPCCSMQTAFVCGNAEEESIFDAWNGGKFKKFQLAMLKNKKNYICKKCEVYKFGMFEEDVLDGRGYAIIERLRM